MIAITGASGQLGRLVINRLLESVPAAQIVALVRDPAKVREFAARGVVVRRADYNEPASLNAALAGVERLLFIASNELGRRLVQHTHVIDAAKRRGVKFIAFTSLLHAASSPMTLAVEYKQTEDVLKASGLPHLILRNGWYSENHTAHAPAALASGTLYGSSGDGLISSAPRADLAEAAAKVIVSGQPSAWPLELAGDTAYTLADLAAEISRQGGKKVTYKNLSEEEYRKVLVGIGMPKVVASVFADSDQQAAFGVLFDDSHQLSKLIGRPTTPIAEVVRRALAPAK
jgi:NAD(P)H dehydrogenase (quinone)